MNMNNIQKFLEEEMLRMHDNYSAFKTDDKETRERIENYKKWWQDHDTRLINFVLGEVEKEWFKAKAETFSGQDEAEKCIETIINNLRVK